MVIVMEFDAEIVLKDITIGAGFKGWTDAIPRENRRAGQNRCVLAVPMEIVFNGDGWRQRWIGALRDAHRHLAAVVRVELGIVLAVANSVLRTIKQHP